MGLVRCNECGEMISDVSKTCPNCGSPQKTSQTNLVHCRECGEMISKSAQSCPKCGAGQNTVMTNNNGDKPDVGICVLAWLLPIVGIIISLVKMSDNREKSKVTEYCIWSVIGLLFWIFCYYLYIFFSSMGSSSSYYY